MLQRLILLVRSHLAGSLRAVAVTLFASPRGATERVRALWPLILLVATQTGLSSQGGVRWEDLFPSLPNFLASGEGKEIAFRFRRVKYDSSLKLPAVREGITRIWVSSFRVFVEEIYLDVLEIPGEIAVPRRLTTCYEPLTGQYARAMEREGAQVIVTIDFMHRLPSIVYYACGALGLESEQAGLDRHNSEDTLLASFSRSDGTGHVVEFSAESPHCVSTFLRHKGLIRGGTLTFFGGAGLAAGRYCDIIVEAQLDQDDIPRDIVVWSAVTTTAVPPGRERLDNVLVPPFSQVFDFRERVGASKRVSILDRPLRLKDVILWYPVGSFAASATETSQREGIPLWKIGSAGLGSLLGLLWLIVYSKGLLAGRSRTRIVTTRSGGSY